VTKCISFASCSSAATVTNSCEGEVDAVSVRRARSIFCASAIFARAVREAMGRAGCKGTYGTKGCGASVVPGIVVVVVAGTPAGDVVFVVAGCCAGAVVCVVVCVAGRVVVGCDAGAVAGGCCWRAAGACCCSSFAV
jgi:hypothetical protein